MEKIVHLIWDSPGRETERLARRILEEAAPRLLDQSPRGLAMDLSDDEAAVPAPVPWPEEEPRLVGVVSLWLDRYEDFVPCQEVLAEYGDRHASYLVSESLCSDYGTNDHAPPRDWPDGKRSPGILAVTLMERPERIAYEDWIAHWHGVQSPVSEAMQPRCRYVRNTVVRPLSDGAPAYQGIVEEGWPSVEHLVDPDLFYGAGGSPEKLVENQRRMFESVRAFLDFDRIRVATMSEYLLKSLPG